MTWLVVKSMLAIAAVAVAVMAAARRDRTIRIGHPIPSLMYSPPTSLPGCSRHKRLELEFHAHPHWGVKRIAFLNGAGAGWSLHVGYGRGCLCVDLYLRGRRP